MAHVARNLHSVDVCHHHFGRIAQDNFFVVLFFFIDAFVENDVGIVDGPVADALVSSADSFGEGFDLFWREDGVGIRGDAEHGDVTVGERVDVVDDRFLHFQWVFLEFIFAEDGDFGRALGIP